MDIWQLMLTKPIRLRGVKEMTDTRKKVHEKLIIAKNKT